MSYISARRNRPILGMSVLMFAWLAPSVSLAQPSLNIDLDVNSPGDPGTGAPSTTFGAAANQAGTWNEIRVGVGPFNLVTTSGTASGVTMTRSAPAGVITFDSGQVGDYARLVYDADNFQTFTPFTYTFNGLPAGRYTIYTYAAAPFISTASTRITVPGSNNAPQIIAGAPTDGTFEAGRSHAVHVINHNGGALSVTAERVGLNGLVNGIQIVPQSLPAATIATPSSCGYVSGVVEVRGTATSPSFSSWVLQYTGGDLSTWVTIASSATQVNNGTLAFWNTAGLRPCAYTLRLLVFETPSGGLETTRSVIAARQGDANLDGVVNFLDVGAVLNNFGLVGP